MSKKKNTLKDLDEFLKQQAATLVSPSRLSDKIEPDQPEKLKEKIFESESGIPESEEPISAEKLLSYLQDLAKREGDRFRGQLYDLIIRSVESQNQYSPEDKMLINTALYLKSGEKWKEAIRGYWKKKG
jgi:hypothetical protein